MLCIKFQVPSKNYKGLKFERAAKIINVNNFLEFLDVIATIISPVIILTLINTIIMREPS